ncbi:hypothetical protein QQ39_00925 [Pragia fontium]|nr:hypothetical protein QQ39_00925 [Pragia fontium]
MISSKLTTLAGIQRLAQTIETDCHTPQYDALDKAAQQSGYRDFEHAQVSLRHSNVIELASDEHIIHQKRSGPNSQDTPSSMFTQYLQSDRTFIIKSPERETNIELTLISDQWRNLPLIEFFIDNLNLQKIELPRSRTLYDGRITLEKLQSKIISTCWFNSNESIEITNIINKINNPIKTKIFSFNVNIYMQGKIFSKYKTDEDYLEYTINGYNTWIFNEIIRYHKRT